MSWDSAIGLLTTELPNFNDYLLKVHRKEKVEECIDVINTASAEAVKLFDGKILYKGCKVLSPEKHLDYIIDNMLTKGRFNIQVSELQLVEFTFEYEHQLYTSHMYLPYLHNGCVVINDTAWYIQIAIIERIIYRMQNCVGFKVMRSPLPFWRSEQFGFQTVDGKAFYETLITVKAHWKEKKRTKKDCKFVLLLYPLATTGFLGTLDSFGIPHTDIIPVPTEEKREGYLTFKCKDDTYLLVKEGLMKDITKRRIVATLVYLLSFFSFYSFDSIWDADTYKIMIGRATFGTEYRLALACSQANTHLSSMATYLDPITKRGLAKQGIYCDDIFDLFIYVFGHIDQLLINHAPNNLYEKKVGVLELMTSQMVESIFLKFYDVIRSYKKTLNPKVVRSLFRISSKRINNIYTSTLVRGNTAYNDNELLSLMAKKVRQAANQNKSGKGSNLITAREHRFDTSFAVIESLLSIPSSSPGVSGSINPFAPITLGDGYFYKPDYAKDIDVLQKYLPSR